MKSFRVLALSLVVLMIFLMAACGGGAKKPVTPPTPLSVSTSLLPPATVNIIYNFVLQGAGGSGTYTWAISKGTLPPGLTLSGNLGEISGTPTTLGVYAFTVQVTDGTGTVATANLTLTVEGAMVISCPSCTGSLLPSGSPGVPYSQNLTATGGLMPYTWCVIESSGACDNGSQGGLPPGLTITTNSDGSATISGTPITPGTPTTFQVQVSDSETPVSRGTASLTITIMAVAPKTLANGMLNTPYNQGLDAVGGIAPWTWTLTGSLPPGLSFGTCIKKQTPNCAITGTPTQQGTTNFSVTVADGENPPATATAALSITVNPSVTNANFKGNYVFSFSGYNHGNPLIMGGVLVADGNGNVTSGELDVNDGSGETDTTCPHSVGTGPQPQTVTSGSVYSINATGTGTLTLVTNSATYNFSVAIRSDGSGSLIQDNSDPNTRGSGVLKVQTTGVVMSQLEGSFALGITGADPSNNRYSAAGQYMLTNPNGDLSPISLDVNDNGAASQQVGNGTLSTTIDSLGRGCFVNLSFNGQHQLYTYSYYIVSANELVIVSTDAIGGSDAANLTLWSILRQTAGIGFNNQSLSGTTVVGISGKDSSGVADVSAGLFVGQGNSSDTCENNTYDPATFTFDENQGGTLSQQPTTLSGTYCVDSSTGRVTLAGFNGVWQTTPPVFYIGGNDPGFVVGTDAAASSGNLIRQSGSPFSNSSVSGLYAGGSFSPVISGVTDSVAALFANASGNITGIQYSSGPGGPAGPTNLTLTYSVDSTGRAVVQQSGTTFGILYVVSPTEFFLLPAGTDPVMNVFTALPTT
jgi:hypothetical protein